VTSVSTRSFPELLDERSRDFVSLMKDQFAFKGDFNFEFNRGSVQAGVSAKQSVFDG
jgi:hypothetical protein